MNMAKDSIEIKPTFDSKLKLHNDDISKHRPTSDNSKAKCN